MCECDNEIGYRCLTHAQARNYKSRESCIASYLADRVSVHILEEYVAHRIKLDRYENSGSEND